MVVNSNVNANKERHVHVYKQYANDILEQQNKN